MSFTFEDHLNKAAPVIKELSKRLAIAEPTAVELYGRLVGALNKIGPTLEECLQHIDMVKAKELTAMSQAEIRIGFCCGFVKPKRKPLIVSATKVSRNSPCPCGSGLKYKNCHLNEAREWDRRQLELHNNPFIGEDKHA